MEADDLIALRDLSKKMTQDFDKIIKRFVELVVDDYPKSFIIDAILGAIISELVFVEDKFSVRETIDNMLKQFREHRKINLTDKEKDHMIACIIENFVNEKKSRE